MSRSPTRKDAATLQQIFDLVGDLEAAKAEAILATQATPEEIAQAQAWADGESDVMGKQERPLSGAVAAVYDILCTEEPLDDRD